MLVIVILIAYLELITVGSFIINVPNYNQADRFLKRNIDKMIYIANNLFELDYDDIEIRRVPSRDEERDSMVIKTQKVNEYGSVSFEYRTIPIPDNLLRQIRSLYAGGICVINCSRDYVDFTKWNSMSESGGIWYSRTGEAPGGIQLIEVRQLAVDNLYYDGNELIEVSQLPIENWYYYVSNYEKAKARNPHLFE